MTELEVLVFEPVGRALSQYSFTEVPQDSLLGTVDGLSTGSITVGKVTSLDHCIRVSACNFSSDDLQATATH